MKRALLHASRPLALVLATAFAAACSTAGVNDDDAPPPPSGTPIELAIEKNKAAREAFDNDDWDDAADLFEEVADGWSGEAIGVEARYWQGESLFRDGEYYEAFKQFEVFPVTHPLFHWIDRVEQRIFECGTRLIVEGRRGALGLGILTYDAQGEEVLVFLTERFPNGRFADDAFVELARHYRNKRDYPLAASTLETMLRRYPNSDRALEARLLLGVSHLDQNRGEVYDPRSLRRARYHYRMFVEQAARTQGRGSAMTAPELASRVALAERRIRQIDETLSAHAIHVANWYAHIENENAAAYYLRRAAARYPETNGGREAAERLRAMGQEVPAPGSIPDRPIDDDPTPDEPPAAGR